MKEHQQEKTIKAVLAAADTGAYDVEQSLEELHALAESAGLEVEGSLVQRRTGIDPATVIGRGRLEELAEYCSLHQVDVVVFDCELSPSQMRNLEEVLQTSILDRTALILDIFATRAVSREGKLQVELAQLTYRLPRLSGLGKALSRLGGGVGTRGPGETKLETDRRHIRRRMTALKGELADLHRRRALHRNRRKKDGVRTIAIVGYTNVGKSTLLGALTDAGILGENKLFATLDPTARALTLPDGGQVLLVDTVGLVRRLPHMLVEAFQSTLEEAAHADLLWCVCDAASHEAQEQVSITRRLMGDLGADEIPMVVVMNKCDLLSEPPAWAGEEAVFVSAKTGFGFERLLRKSQELLSDTHVRGVFLLPYTEGALDGEIRRTGRVFSQQHTPQGTRIDAMVDKRILHKLRPFLQTERNGSAGEG